MENKMSERIILEKKEDGKWSILEEAIDTYKEFRKMQGDRISIKHIEKGNIVKIINNEAADIIGTVDKVKGDEVYIHVGDEKYSANIKDIRLLAKHI